MALTTARWRILEGHGHVGLTFSLHICDQKMQTSGREHQLCTLSHTSQASNLSCALATFTLFSSTLHHFVASQGCVFFICSLIGRQRQLPTISKLAILCQVLAEVGIGVLAAIVPLIGHP